MSRLGRTSVSVLDSPETCEDCGREITDFVYHRDAEGQNWADVCSDCMGVTA